MSVLNRIQFHPDEKGVGAGLLLLVVLMSLPAWTGSWIYDDWYILDNPHMSSLKDVPQAFLRTSHDYLAWDDPTAVGGVTYRPFASLSLILVQVISSRTPLLHHLVSLIFHLLIVVLLHRTLLAIMPRHPSLFFTALFALHPLGIEAWGWINGRADVLAAVFVVLLARHLYHREGRSSVVAVSCCIAGATLSKETGLIAAVGLVVACAFPNHGLPKRSDLRRLFPRFGAVAATVVLLAAIRMWIVGGVGTGLSNITASELLTPVGRLFANGLESAFIPLPRTMRCLAFDLSRPVSASQWALVAAGAIAVSTMLWHRRFRSAVLLLVAGLSLAPAVFVQDAFWLGLDRYLYIPLLLSILAIASALPTGHLPTGLRAPARWTAVPVALLLSISSFFTAQTYASQRAHLLAMVEMRPTDPTGHMLAAIWLHKAEQPDAAHAALKPVSRTGLPSAHASRMITLLSELGHPDESAVVFEDMVRRFPWKPTVQYDAVVVRLVQRNLPDAFRIADGLIRRFPAYCRGVHATIDQIAKRDRWDEDLRQQGRAFQQAHSCDP